MVIAKSRAGSRPIRCSRLTTISLIIEILPWRREAEDSIVGVGALVGIDAGQPSDHRLVDMAAADSSRCTSRERNWAAGVLLRGCALTSFPSPARLLPAKGGILPLGFWRYVLCTSS